MKVYIASPFRAKTRLGVWLNIRRAKKYGRLALREGHTPIIPHVNSLALFGMKGDDKSVVYYDDELLRSCDMLFLCGKRITKGMRHEEEVARFYGLLIYRKYENNTN